MLPFRWFKTAHSNRSFSAHKLCRRLPLHLECLEDRSVPAAGAGMASTTVSGLYFDVLHRQASQGEINGWNQSIQLGASPTLVAQMFVGSPENLRAQSSGIYQGLFGQGPSPSMLASMTAELQGNGGNLQVLKYEQVLSDAYFSKIANGNNSTWVSNVYYAVLGRGPDNQGLGFWSGQLASGAPRQGVAASLVFSVEALQRAVGDAYHQILGRNADTGGISFWANGMRNGMTQDQLEAQLAASPEYAAQYARATLPVSGQVIPIDVRATSAALQNTDYYTTATPKKIDSGGCQRRRKASMAALISRSISTTTAISPATTCMARAAFYPPTRRLFRCSPWPWALITFGVSSRRLPAARSRRP